MQKFKKLSVQPGSFLHFNGFVNLHFNIRIDKDERLSILIHNDKVFEKSIIVKLTEMYSRFSAP